MRRSTVRSMVLSVAIFALATSQAWAARDAGTPAVSIDPVLRQQLASAAAGTNLTVFVHGDAAITARVAATRAGLRVFDTFEQVGIAVATGVPAAVRRLARDASVSYLEADKPIAFALDSANKATRGDIARAGFVGTDSQTSTGLDGSGVTIAVVDSGIDGTHPMFQVNGKSKVVRNLKLQCHENAPAYFPNLAGQGQVPPSTCPADSAARETFWTDFTNTTNDTDTPSLGGHGTHVAGIAAGVDVTTADGRKLHGAAPGAKLVGLSVGNSISVYGGAAGLNWVLDHHAAPCGAPATADCPPIRVASNSWGLVGGGNFDPNAAVVKIENALVAAGVVVTFANGNDGGDGTRNVSSPYAQNPVPGVLGVANYNDAGTGTRDGALNSSSSRGLKGKSATYPDISAPGTAITSACRLTLSVCGTGLDVRDPNYNTISGTSMATPLVSGIVAQLIQAGATPAQVEDAIDSTAYKFTFGAAYENDPANPGLTTSFDKGRGLVDAKAAVAKIRNIPIEPSTPPPPGGGGSTCVADGPIGTDPAGDATGPASLNNTGGPNEAGLDMREGRLSWNGTAQALTFGIKVTDLQTTNPQTAPNVSYNYTFNYAGAAYEVEAARDADGTEQFVFGKVINAQATTARQHLREVGGSFDAANDVISVTVTNADLAALGVKPFATNDQLDAFAITSRRAVTTSTTTAGPAADTVTGTCPYTIGVGAVPSPATADGSAAIGQDYTWTGGPFTRANEVQDPCPAKPYQGCDVRRVSITLPAEGATLTVSITSEYADVTDFDVYVYLPDGTEFDHAANLGSAESISKAATVAGIYTIVVKPYLAVDATYSGTVHLS